MEAKTREQANSRILYKMPAGRITAPNFKHTSCTDPGYSSKSLLVSVCQAEIYTFSSNAIKCGCQHEQHTLSVYVQQNKSQWYTQYEQSCQHSHLKSNQRWNPSQLHGRISFAYHYKACSVVTALFEEVKQQIYSQKHFREKQNNM